jgi:glycosyltransferase involved in cell wall biosynthesis
MSSNNPAISAIIITRNEQSNIEACLESLNWVDEIVVVDSGSTDDTRTLARRYTDKVFVEEWCGQGVQKNRAIAHAKGPWIFSLDADERVPQDLAREIREATGQNRAIAYAVKRKNFYKGRWIRHSGWWPDWVTRVFLKGQAEFSRDVIHESVQVASQVIKLRHAIDHHSFTAPMDFLNRAAWYAYHQAKAMHANGRKASVWTAAGHAGFAFIQAFFLRLGFLDGSAGLLIAASNCTGVFYRYMILRDLWLYGAS